MLPLLAEDEAGLFDSLWDIQGQLLSIVLTTLVICTLSIIYNVKIRNHKENERMSGFLVLVEMFITAVENLVVSIMGKRYRKLTPYAMYIILYIVTSSILGLIGIETAVTSYTVTFSMGFVTFIAIYYFGFKYQKLAYFKRYINPIEILTQFTPLLSISFRLFGNILGGSIIMGLFYAMAIGFQANWGGGEIDRIWEATKNWDRDWDQQYIYFWSGLNIFTTLLAPWLHMYFDLFDGTIQSIVFTMLTLSYWSEAIGESDEVVDMKENYRRVEAQLSGESSIDQNEPPSEQRPKDVVMI